MSFPEHIPPDDLANNFGSFFIQKIDDINNSLDALDLPPESSDADKDVSADGAYVTATFTNFKSLTQGQAAKLIRNATKKSCPFDPIPTSVLLPVLDVLLPVITKMVNMSFG